MQQCPYEVDWVSDDTWGFQAAGGVSSDRFLQSQVFSQDEINEAGGSEDRLTVLYFLKVIHLFEQFGYYGKCNRNVMTSSIQNSIIVPLTIVEIKGEIYWSISTKFTHLSRKKIIICNI